MNYKKYNKENKIIYSLNNLFNLHIFYKYNDNFQTEKIMLGGGENVSYTKYEGNKTIQKYEVNDNYVTSLQEISPNFFKNIKYNKKRKTFNKSICFVPENDVYLKIEKYQDKEKRNKENIEFTIKNINYYE